MSDAAPFLSDLAEAPKGVLSEWRHAEDGVRLRATHWAAPDPRGSILLFSGRTEYAEKYGRVIDELQSAGFAGATIDWRGQGLSDRLHDDPMLGHIGTFTDYQMDVAELVTFARDKALPQPWYLLAHSMGGGIGLRALIEGLPVEKAVFSAPMWGIHIHPIVQPLSVIFPPVAAFFGFQDRYAFGTRNVSYLYESTPTDNLLTSDPEHFEYMVRHVDAEPLFGLGGPSIHWVGKAKSETRLLSEMPRPKIKTKVYFGSNEGIVSTDAIHRIVKNWAEAQVDEVSAARHELMMEASGPRSQFMSETIKFLT